MRLALGDVDANGDVIDAATPLLVPVPPLDQIAQPDLPSKPPAASLPPDEPPAAVASLPNDQLRAIVRRAREANGPRRLRWSLRERLAFQTLCDRGVPC